MINATAVGKSATRIGVLAYGNFGQLPEEYSARRFTGFHLNEFYTLETINEAIDMIRWKDETTNTSGAIRYATDTMFRSTQGARGSAPDIAIVITDGVSTTDGEHVNATALAAKNKNITVFALGIGNETNEAELQAIATNSSYKYEVENFSTLGSIKSKLVTAACDIPVGKCR